MSERSHFPCIAFLGCGSAAGIHSRTLSSVAPGVRRFYASRDPSRAREYTRRYGGAGWFHSYKAAIVDERMNAVVVATPPSSRLEWVLCGLDAGRDVILEQPAFPSSSDFAQVRERLRTSTGQILVAENYRYKPLTAALRRWIARRDPEELRFIGVNAGRFRPREGWREDPDAAGGGPHIKGAIHWISMMASLGLEVDMVDGFQARSDVGPDWDVLVVFRFVGGCVGSLHCSWKVHAKRPGLCLSRIYGTNSSLSFESNGAFLASWRGPLHFELPGLHDIDGYRAMFRDFLRAIRTKSTPLYTLDDAERDLWFVEQASSNALVRKPVPDWMVPAGAGKTAFRWRDSSAAV